MYGPPVLLALAAAAGLGWSFAVRAATATATPRRPETGGRGRSRGWSTPAAGPDVAAAALGGRVAPPYLPGHPRAALALSVLATLPSNAEDSRYRVFQRAEAAVTRRIAQRPEHQRTVDHPAGGKGQQRYQHSTADLVVSLPGPAAGPNSSRCAAPLPTPSSPAAAPSQSCTPRARPGWAAWSTTRRTSPPTCPACSGTLAAPVAALLGVYAFVMLGWIFTVLSHRGRAKAKVIAADSAAGRVRAVTGPRWWPPSGADTTGPGNRPGTAAVTSQHWLELRMAPPTFG